MNTNTETIIKFLTGQMDGEPVPPSDSAAVRRLAEAVAAIQDAPSDGALIELALHTLRAVIDRVQSGINAETVLQSFLRGGGHA